MLKMDRFDGKKHLNYSWVKDGDRYYQKNCQIQKGYTDMRWMDFIGDMRSGTPWYTIPYHALFTELILR